MRPVVFYYSETGNTEKVARAVREATDGSMKRIETGTEDLVEGKPVFVGTPVHAFKPAKPMMRFIEENEWDGVKTAVFCTYSLYPGKTLRWMRERIEGDGGEVLGELKVKGRHPMVPFLARGRPDKRDLEKAALWARKVLKRV